MKTKCALIGTGLMGTPIGLRLLAAQYELSIWNRTSEKCLPLVAHGAIAAPTVVDAVSQADVIITMLSNGEAVSEVLSQEGVMKSMKPGATLIDMSSIPPDVAKKHAQWCAKIGINALDAPVSGGVVGAEQGTLAIMVGGDRIVFEQLLPLLKVLGTPTYIGSHGAGALAKLANQMIVGITIAAVAEAMTLMEEAGASARAVREAIRGGFAESRILELHGLRMIDRSFAPGAHSTTQLKDLNTAHEVARSVGLSLPVLEKTRELFQSFVHHGGKDLDHSALILEIERINAHHPDHEVKV